MTVLDAAYWVACAVLVVSGVSKLPTATTTEATLGELGLRLPAGSGRLLGAVEGVLGVAGLALAPRAAAVVVAALVALAYGGFAVVVDAARRAGLEDCGCLGATSSAPTVSHVVFDGGLAVVAVATAVVGPIGIADGLGELPTAWAIAVGFAVAACSGGLVAFQAR